MTLVMYEEEFNKITKILDRLLEDSNAKVVFLVDKKGQLIAASGDYHNLDTTSLASLTAGNIKATGGLAKLLDEKEYSILFHEGERDNLHILIVGSKVLLVILFDQKDGLSLVREKAGTAGEELAVIFKQLEEKAKKEGDWPGGSGSGGSGSCPGGGDPAFAGLRLILRDNKVH